jgi:hypothetical protein
LKQEWQFKIDLQVELGRPCDSIIIESLLNKTGIGKPVIPATCRGPTPFHIYFTSASATEFTLSAEHGILEPAIGLSTNVPVDVIFAPKMYGKILKGLLVIDTIEAQYLFEVLGRTPEYVPPVVSKSKDIPPPVGVENNVPMRRRRNIIQDNIESVRIVKPMKLRGSVGSPKRT